MASLTIRQLDDTTHARLRGRAAEHGRSVEAEVRAILDAAVGRPDVNFLVVCVPVEVKYHLEDSTENARTARTTKRKIQ